ncbi:hypothetical protein DXG01_002989 [Tephrocybe rancida]|nr:hypothetical protein DXG01_002989 [Tephrocybe rancida]
MHNAPIPPLKSHKATKIRINVIGPASHALARLMEPASTVSDVVRSSVHSGLQRVEPAVYFPPYQSGPLEHDASLSSIGVRDGSTLHIRWRMRGGAPIRSHHDNTPGVESSASSMPASSLQFNKRTGHFTGENAKDFEPLPSGLFKCRLCLLIDPMESRRVVRHERSKGHQYTKLRQSASGPAGPSTSHQTVPEAADPHIHDLHNAVHGTLDRLLSDIRSRPYDTHNPQDDSWVDNTTGMAESVDWESVEFDIGLQPSLDTQIMRDMAEKSRNYLLDPEGINDNSDSAAEERSNPESDDNSETVESHISGDFFQDPSQSSTRTKRQTSTNPQDPFFLWPDRETAILDILRHIPRSSFSRKQNEIIHWSLLALGVTNIPSDRVMDDIDRALQQLCGIESLRYDGALGHVYYTNDLAGIIAQEWANPTVRRHLHIYPEDSGNHLSEAWQAARWRDELHSDLTTPMVRIHRQDFYINEICFTRHGAFVPHRWLINNNELYGRAWRVVATAEGWIVDVSQAYNVMSTDLLLSRPQFVNNYMYYQVPHPDRIIGQQDLMGELTQWPFPLENCWRLRSSGHRVMAFPMWLYCDDTSGNQSKKWNKHNSFLFTAAGLPRRLVHQEGNVLFLSTSNIVPPLEMLDGIVNQLEVCQRDGIWAWDCEANEKILIIPSILAMLGDNPMQSEFACHIGLRGRQFCRICHVEGDVEGAEDNGGDLEEPGVDPEAVANQDSDVSNASVGSQVTSKKGKRSNKKSETMVQMIQCVTNFMSIGTQRKKAETQKALRSQFIEGSWVGGMAASKRLKTAGGVKDTYQDHFLKKLFAISSKRGQSKDAKEKAMAELRRSFPSNITSPIWRILTLIRILL